MGITYSQARFLLQARTQGVSFSRTCTIGRMTAYLRPGELASLQSEFSVEGNPELLFGQSWCDRFFSDFLGAERVTAIDYSDYEGAGLVHDMNLPLPHQNCETFDAVIDSGTLEHVFNFPVAISNCMNLVRTGGSLFLFTMANNHCGHGFYQFSPELMFRIFQPENGFRIEQVLLEAHPFPGRELTSAHPLYRVSDPAEVRSRVGLVTSSPVMMMVHATKTNHVPVFQTPPLQSDYTVLWQGSGQTPAGEENPESSLRRLLHATGLLTICRILKKACLRLVPEQLKTFAKGRRQLSEYSLKNRRFYTPIDP